MNRNMISKKLFNDAHFENSVYSGCTYFAQIQNGTIGTIQNYSWQGIINPHTMDSRSGLNYILLIANNYSFISEVILSPYI